MDKLKQKKICFVVTTPFTVNGFLINHLTELAKLYQVSLCINLNQYALSPKLDISNLEIILILFSIFLKSTLTPTREE